MFGLLCATGLLLLGSCADGYESPDGFDVGVRNTQMVTPGADSISFVTDMAMTSATISWPLQLGAGGYEVTFANVDDPNNHVIIDGYDKKIVDGCQMTVSVAEDCKYLLTIRALGNKDLGNKDDAEAKQIELSTMVKSLLTIPAGNDIYEYLAANPLPAAEYVGQVGAIDLEYGADYTCHGPVDFGGYNMTFRGSKVKPNIITMKDSAAFYFYGGLTMKFLRIDNTASTAGSVIYISPKETLPDTILSENHGNYMRDGSVIKGIYMIENPLYLSDVWIKNIHNSLIHDNSVKVGLHYLTINNCLLQQSYDGGDAFINFYQKGVAIKHINFANTTFYNTLDNSKGYWIRYENESNAQPAKAWGNFNSEYNNTTCDVTSCTFSKCYSGQKMTDRYRRSILTTKVSRSIFYDCNNVDRFAGIGTKYFSFNFWWAFTKPNNGDATMKDNTGSPFAQKIDPGFTPDNYTKELDLTQPNGGVSFTPAVYDIIANRGGDSRWLPSTSVEE